MGAERSIRGGFRFDEGPTRAAPHVFPLPGHRTLAQVADDIDRLAYDRALRREAYAVERDAAKLREDA